MLPWRLPDLLKLFQGIKNSPFVFLFILSMLMIYFLFQLTFTSWHIFWPYLFFFLCLIVGYKFTFSEVLSLYFSTCLLFSRILIFFFCWKNYNVVSFVCCRNCALAKKEVLFYVKAYNHLLFISFHIRLHCLLVWKTVVQAQQWKFFRKTTIIII